MFVKNRKKFIVKKRPSLTSKSRKVKFFVDQGKKVLTPDVLMILDCFFSFPAQDWLTII
jgi:hypothetical protein